MKKASKASKTSASGSKVADTDGYIENIVRIARRPPEDPDGRFARLYERLTKKTARAVILVEKAQAVAAEAAALGVKYAEKTGGLA